MRASPIRNVVLATLLFMALVYLTTRPSAPPPGRGIQPDDPDLACDPSYRVCFTPTSSIDKTIPQPVQLNDLTITTRSNPPGAGQIPSRNINMLHYPGSIFRIEDRTNNPPGGYANDVIVDENNVALFDLQGCTITKSEGRPDRLAYVCNNGLQFAITPITRFTFLIDFSLRCTAPCVAEIYRPKRRNSVNYETTWGIWNGYPGHNVTFSNGSYQHTFYLLYSNPPTPPNDINGTQLQGPAYDGLAVIALEPDLVNVPSIFNNPTDWIMNATAFFQDWYRMYAAPTRCTTDWCRERYYRAVTTHNWIALQGNPASPGYWRTPDGADRLVMSPGGMYIGAWIWDSFFQAFAGVNNCRMESCADRYMDSYRVLSAQQAPTGQMPRQVEPYEVKGPPEWQPPGGWSFIINQADKKFGTSQWSAEFYDSLNRSHAWVRTRDFDSDGVFQWGGGDSGWDDSPRWAQTNMDALDLQAWMVLDAEALRDIATRLGFVADATQFELWRQSYLAGFRSLCTPGPYCYDRFPDNDTPLTLLTPAMYLGLLAGAFEPAAVDAILPPLRDPALLGPGPGNIGILPSLSRNDPLYDPCAQVSRKWGGPYWVNLMLATYLGLERYGLTTDAELVRNSTLNLLQQGGISLESYCSTTIAGYPVGSKPQQAAFSNPYYGWSDSATLLMSAPLTFDFTPATACTDGQTTPCNISNDVGLRTCAVGAWGPCIVCTPGVTPNRSCGTSGTQSCVGTGQWGVCAECQSVWYVGNWSECAYDTTVGHNISNRTCVDSAECQPPNNPPTCTMNCECSVGMTQICTVNSQPGHKTCLADTLMWGPCAEDACTDGQQRTCQYSTQLQGLQTCAASAWSACNPACIQGTDLPWACGPGDAGTQSCDSGQWSGCTTTDPCAGGPRPCHLPDGTLSTQYCDTYWLPCGQSWSCTPNTERGCGAGGTQTCNPQGTGYTACCLPAWDCGDGFGACVLGSQSETCTDANACGAQSTITTTRSCVCQEDQTRNCASAPGVDGRQTCTAGQWGACVDCGAYWTYTYSQCLNSQWLVTRTDATGCANTTQTTGTCTSACATDTDGDGFKSEASCLADQRDCNDGNAAINPSRPEACNGLDDDCDGLTDEGPPQRTCYVGWNAGVQNCTGARQWGSCYTISIATSSCLNAQCQLDINGPYLSSSACQAVCHCLPEWSCTGWTDWSEATCGLRTQVCTDRRSCPTVTSPQTRTDALPCPGTVCGNSIVERGERCDNLSLAGHTCRTEDNTSLGGTLACANCTSFTTDACTYAPPKLTHYGCNAQNACVPDPDGMYLDTACNRTCAPPPIIPYFYWLGGAFAAGFILWLLLRRRP